MSESRVFAKIEELRRTVTILVYGFFIVLLLSYVTVAYATAGLLGDLLIVVLLGLISGEVIVFSLGLYLLSRPLLRFNTELEKEVDEGEGKKQ